MLALIFGIACTVAVAGGLFVALRLKPLSCACHRMVETAKDVAKGAAEHTCGRATFCKGRKKLAA